MLQQHIIHAADGIRAVSDAIGLAVENHGVPRERIRVIHTPINTELFMALTKEQQLLEQKLRYKYGDRFIMLFCGRLVTAKNLLFTLEVIRGLMTRRKDFIL